MIKIDENTQILKELNENDGHIKCSETENLQVPIKYNSPDSHDNHDFVLEPRKKFLGYCKSKRKPPEVLQVEKNVYLMKKHPVKLYLL